MLAIELISFPYKPIKLKHDDPIIIIIIIIIISSSSSSSSSSSIIIIIIKNTGKYVKLNGSRETKGRVICELYLPILYCWITVI